MFVEKYMIKDRQLLENFGKQKEMNCLLIYLVNISRKKMQ